MMNYDPSIMSGILMGYITGPLVLLTMVVKGFFPQQKKLGVLLSMTCTYGVLPMLFAWSIYLATHTK